MIRKKKKQNKGPKVSVAIPATYAWCACGLSDVLPFCDGAHGITEFSPVRIKIEEEKTVAWCMCQKTKTPPFCDGSHDK